MCGFASRRGRKKGGKEGGGGQIALEELG